MPKVKVYNLSKKGVGEMDLSDSVFDATVNESLLYDVLKAQLASHRKGAASSQTRAEVSATSRKLYKQKGTGGARHGSKRAPIFVGGGAAHGPKPRDFGYRPPRKMRLGALKGALSLKLREGQLLIVQDFELSEIKTKKLAEVLDKLEVNGGALIVDVKDNEKLRLSARNLQGHSVLPPEGVNLYDLLRHEHLVNKYTFEVDLDANKLQIKDAVETLFKVTVRDVRTLIVRGHMKRMGRGYGKLQNWKKAIVTLPEGETIDFFEGV
jgi:large subunit ribosomal protein L4